MDTSGEASDTQRPADSYISDLTKSTLSTSRDDTLAAIFVLGPSSSGKTTLCDALAENLCLDRSRYIKEVARDVMRKTGFTRNDAHTYEMQVAIMKAQIQAEERVMRRIAGEEKVVDVAGHRDKEVELLLLSDRSAVDPIVYALTAKVSNAEETSRKLLEDIEFQEILPFYRESLFVVLRPVDEWIYDDGVRSMEDPWRYLIVLRQTLETLGIPFVEIGEDIKDIGKRVERVKQLLAIRCTVRNGDDVL